MGLFPTKIEACEELSKTSLYTLNLHPSTFNIVSKFSPSYKHACSPMIIQNDALHHHTAQSHTLVALWPSCMHQVAIKYIIDIQDSHCKVSDIMPWLVEPQKYANPRVKTPHTTYHPEARHTRQDVHLCFLHMYIAVTNYIHVSTFTPIFKLPDSHIYTSKHASNTYA